MNKGIFYFSIVLFILFLQSIVVSQYQSVKANPTNKFTYSEQCIKIYDVTDKKVETIVNEKLQAGKYETQWNGSIYSSGVYFYKMIVRHGGSSTGEFTEMKRMLLVK